jgi:anti-anti-sigma regulatory factor
MLKISTLDTPTEHRIVLVGKLVGPWIRELQKVWEQDHPQLGNRRCVVDLNDVTLIDGSADGLLLAMSKQGAELVARNMENRWLIQALKNGKTRVYVRTLRSNNPGFS